MAAHITIAQAKAWADGVKLDVTSLDAELELQESNEVLGELSSAFTVTTWIDATTTPPLVQKIIAMKYVGWLFQRIYSEDSDISTYGMLLLAESDKLIDGLVNGSLTIPGLPIGIDLGLSGPVFYPTDASTALEASSDDSSLGREKFTMGVIW